MRTYEISSPRAAEQYFSNSIIGHFSMLLAEAFGNTRRRTRVARGKRPGGSADKSTAKSVGARRKGWLDRLDAWFWRLEQKDREAYLARSHDVFELERRIRELERGAIRRYY